MWMIDNFYERRRNGAEETRGRSNWDESGRKLKNMMVSNEMGCLGILPSFSVSISGDLGFSVYLLI